MRLTIPILINCLLVLGVYLVDKYTPTKKLPYMTKQVIVGILFGISVLSLFSALIDSASYFDRLGGIKAISTPLSLICVGLILVLCVVWAIREFKK